MTVLDRIEALVALANIHLQSPCSLCLAGCNPHSMTHPSNAQLPPPHHYSHGNCICIHTVFVTLSFPAQATIKRKAYIFSEGSRECLGPLELEPKMIYKDLQKKVQAANLYLE